MLLMSSMALRGQHPYLSCNLPLLSLVFHGRVIHASNWILRSVAVPYAPACNKSYLLSFHSHACIQPAQAKFHDYPQKPSSQHLVPLISSVLLTAIRCHDTARHASMLPAYGTIMVLSSPLYSCSCRPCSSWSSTQLLCCYSSDPCMSYLGTGAL
jgi:hypothetical protein